MSLKDWKVIVQIDEDSHLCDDNKNVREEDEQAFARAISAIALGTSTIPISGDYINALDPPSAIDLGQITDREFDAEKKCIIFTIS